MSEVPLKGVFWTTGSTIGPADPLRTTREQLEQAEQLRRRGELDRARAICEPLVTRYGDYFGALHTLGLIYADKGNYPMALGFLVRAAMLNPQNWSTLTALSGVYLRLGASEMAAHTLEQARLIKPQSADILITLGEIYREEREYELARDAYRNAHTLEPSLEAAAIGLANCYTDLGRFAEAARVLESLIARGVHRFDLLSALNLLPKSVVSLDALRELDKVTKPHGKDKQGFDASVAFVRGGFLDKAGHHEQAWQQIVSANRAVFNPVEARGVTETQQANLTWLKQNSIKPRRDVSRKTISLFILGPSRSGKTSIETLLGTLPDVKRGYENPIVEKALRRTFQSAGFLNAAVFEALPPQFYSECRDIYLHDLSQRAESARVFSNTHPSHIHYAAHIANIFPNVRFIFVKRNRDDLAWRIFMSQYRRGNAYAYNLQSVREHIDWYYEMIDLLSEKIPDICRVIQYEDLVVEPTTALRISTELCGLPMPENTLPSLGDDRGCAAPYREFMNALL